MPNATAQLVVGPLLRRSAFFFSGGIREDVLGNLFSSNDFLRKQVKAEKQREVNHGIAIKNRRKD
jgi:hypothetical protein